MIDVLKANRHLRSFEEVAAFDNALAELPDHAEPRHEFLRELFTVFDDGCEQIEVMWGLLHFLESFDDDDFLRALVDATPTVISQAPEWLEIFHSRVLNNEAAREALRRVLESSDPVSRRATRRVLQRIADNEAPPLSTSARYVLGS